MISKRIFSFYEVKRKKNAQLVISKAFEVKD